VSGLTPSQTVGPFFSIGLDWPQANRLTSDQLIGQPLVLTGQVLDGEGQPVPDALLEIWQADASGSYPRPGSAGFSGAGRCATDADGRYVFETLKPGGVTADDGIAHAPVINLVLFARGLLTHLYTRVYFPEETAANAVDPALGCVPEARRASLLAQREGDHYRFDIRLQGEAETVFFDV
jgi:protocatechuate 3,4-dioxygenase alpha subunit